jgi:lipoate-protein ligase A
VTSPTPPLKILRHEDVDPLRNPTGEILLSRSVKPYKVWIPDSNCIVLGNSQDPEKELRVDEIARDGIPVFKRMSGGGAVLLSSGCLCVGLRFAKQKGLHIQDYFSMGSDLIRAVVSGVMGADLQPRGISDLVAGDRKVAGCALYMPRDFVLYLVSILFDPHFPDIEKYLAHPSKEPEYRSGRSHQDFLAGLAEFAPKGITAAGLASVFEREIPPVLNGHLDWERYEGPERPPASV